MVDCKKKVILLKYELGTCSHDANEPSHKVVYLKKSNMQLNIQDLPPNTYPLPIKQAKADDLKKLAQNYVPEPAKNMYMDLQISANYNLSL